MLVVFEGCDGAGKTTLLNKVKKELKWPVIKMPQAEIFFGNEDVLNALSENYDKILGIIADSDYNFLVDRAFLTNLVYSKVYKRDNDLSYVYSIMNKTNIKYIVLIGDPGKIKERKQDEIIIGEDLDKVSKEYSRVAKKYLKRTLVLNTTELGEEECFKKIIKFIGVK